jgi:uncharacterized metal-binding protein
MKTDGNFVVDDVYNTIGLDFASMLTIEQKYLIMVLQHHREMYKTVCKWRSGDVNEMCEITAKLYIHAAEKIGMPNLFDERVIEKEVGP